MSFDFRLENGDIVIGTNGSPDIVTNQSKLIQDILKILFTAVGENKHHPWYGTQLLAKAVGTSHDTEALVTEIVSSIEYGINNLKTLQQMQEQDNQFVTPREMISMVKDVSAEADPNDPRKIVVSLQVITRSNDLISESFIVSV